MLGAVVLLALVGRIVATVVNCMTITTCLRPSEERGAVAVLSAAPQAGRM
ncbi:hypothetical protein [Cereibacter azotoformans]|nr:hypothetical protein [Cereibacter azotoformans]